MPKLPASEAVRAERPGDARLVQHLGVADEAFHVRRGEEVGGGRDQQEFRAFDVERQLDGDAGFLLDFLLKPFERVLQRLGRQAEIVANLMDLGDDLVGVFLPHADGVHDLAGGHGDFGGVDAEGAVSRAAPALRALVEIAVPLVEHFAGEVFRADEPGGNFPGQREIAAVDLAHQVLARGRHVLGIAGAHEIVAFVGAGAAAHATVEIDPQRAVVLDEIAKLQDRLFLPVFDKLAREAKRLLVLGQRHKRLAPRHRAAGNRRARQAGPHTRSLRSGPTVLRVP